MEISDTMQTRTQSYKRWGVFLFLLFPYESLKEYEVILKSVSVPQAFLSTVVG